MQSENQPMGIITSIKRFMLEDGPGIRTVVFFGGCPLRCTWCSSPQTWMTNPVIMYSKRKCVLCGRCSQACRFDAILQDPEKRVNRELCRACGACVDSCPPKALRWSNRPMRVDEVMQEIERDADFYETSGGGVTLSGGEATVQPEFACALLQECKLRGIHTAVESCGHIRWENMEQIIQFADLLKIDIKNMDEAAHKAITGVSNQLILKNIERAAATQQCEIVINVPLVPDFNDSPENLTATAAFMVQNKLRTVHLLPFHKLGLLEYEELNMPCPSKDFPTPTVEALAMAKQIFLDHSIDVIH